MSDLTYENAQISPYVLSAMNGVTDLRLEFSKVKHYQLEVDDEGKPVTHSNGDLTATEWHWSVAMTRRTEAGEYGLAIALTPETMDTLTPEGFAGMVDTAREAVDEYELENFGAVLEGPAFERVVPNV